MEESKSFVINLSKIKGSGEFSCPKCGSRISPDDGTEEIYTVLEPVMNGDRLEKILLQCNKCMSRIQLVGLSLRERSD